MVHRFDKSQQGERTPASVVYLNQVLVATLQQHHILAEYDIELAGA